jgi:EAL domain-containing protein (putative c-di-GMP-specific phosphodiesterase class I)
VCFEITETAAITNLQKATALIDQLRALGCRFSLDDFGTGMSSFGYLKNLHVDYLKIDGSFIQDIVHSAPDRAIVQSINQVAHATGKYTIAEFADDSAIVECLVDIGVDHVQGYGIGFPEPLEPNEASGRQHNALIR